MLAYPLKPEPPGFSTDAARLLAEVRRQVVADGGPRTAHFDGRELWTRRLGPYKDELLTQRGALELCFWCEQTRSGRRELHVDHVRPKAAHDRWSALPPLIADVPPPTQRTPQRGYWWLAFTWSNYALACADCNSDWKRCLFPLPDDAIPGGEGCEHEERPLLLLPGEPFRTADHFSWTVDGIMLPCSDRGAATLRTCGLNRLHLVSARKKVLRDVYRDRDDLLRALRQGDDPSLHNAIAQVARRGRRGEAFAGMTRWVIEQAVGLPWEEINGLPP
jgi:hypothetical protein